jgi:toxin FitB
MTYLLDTNVVSELRKRNPDPAVLAWYDKVTSAEIFLCVLTIGEIRLGIEQLRRKDNPRADLLEQWLRGLRTAYGDRSGVSALNPLDPPAATGTEAIGFATTGQVTPAA